MGNEAPKESIREPEVPEDARSSGGASSAVGHGRRGSSSSTSSAASQETAPRSNSFTFDTLAKLPKLGRSTPPHVVDFEEATQGLLLILEEEPRDRTASRRRHKKDRPRRPAVEGPASRRSAPELAEASRKGGPEPDEEAFASHKSAPELPGSSELAQQRQEASHEVAPQPVEEPCKQPTPTDGEARGTGSRSSAGQSAAQPVLASPAPAAATPAAAPPADAVDKDAKRDTPEVEQLAKIGSDETRASGESDGKAAEEHPKAEDVATDAAGKVAEEQPNEQAEDEGLDTAGKGVEAFEIEQSSFVSPSTPSKTPGSARKRKGAEGSVKRLASDWFSKAVPAEPSDKNEAAEAAFVELWDQISMDEGVCVRWRNGGQKSDSHKLWSKIYTSRHSLEARLTAAIHAGVPPSLRGRVWYACSGADRKRLQTRKNYAKLKAAGQDLEGTEAARVLEADIPRTGVRGRRSEALRSVLLAFAAKNPVIGYCQSMNFIVATLLLYMSEEQAFWSLCSIVECMLPEGYYTDTMSGLRVDLKVFDSLVEQYLPELHRHFVAHDIDLSPITMNWFLCLFVNTLPNDLSHHILDIVLHDGSCALFRTALAVLRLRSEELLGVPTVMESYFLLRVPFGCDEPDKFQSVAPTSTTAEELVECAHGTWLKGLSEKVLAELRQKHEKQVQEEDEELAARRQSHEARMRALGFPQREPQQASNGGLPGEASERSSASSQRSRSVEPSPQPPTSVPPSGGGGGGYSGLTSRRVKESPILGRHWLAKAAGCEVRDEQDADDQADIGPAKGTYEEVLKAGTTVEFIPQDTPRSHEAQGRDAGNDDQYSEIYPESTSTTATYASCREA